MITLVVYWGEDEWQGAKSLHDILDFGTELRTLFELYDLRKDRIAFTQYVNEHEECRQINTETYWALGILLNTTKLKAILPRLERTERNMGNVIDEIWDEAEEKGLLEGKLTTLYNLVHDGLLSIQDAATRAAMTEKEFTSEMHKAGY